MGGFDGQGVAEIRKIKASDGGLINNEIETVALGLWKNVGGGKYVNSFTLQQVRVPRRWLGVNGVAN